LLATVLLAVVLPLSAVTSISFGPIARS
jgi:hypothetical protein